MVTLLFIAALAPFGAMLAAHIVHARHLAQIARQERINNGLRMLRNADWDGLERAAKGNRQ